MKQVEITTRVYNSLEELYRILTDKGYKVIRKSRIEDIYLSQYANKLYIENIKEILDKSILIRYLNANGEIAKKITYKEKNMNMESYNMKKK